MSDGATNPTPTQVQCANCSAEDSIVIAGKTFCATCGTPQKPGASSATPPATGPSLSTSTPTSGVAPAGPTSEKMPLDIDASLPAPPSKAGAPNISKPSILDSVEPDVSAATPVSIGATVAPTIDSPSSSTASSSVSSNQLHDSPQVSSDAGIQKFSARPASYDSTTQANQPSEIDSLSDGKEESVMSDSALAELSQTNDLPVPTEISSLETTQSPAPVESSYKLDLTKPAPQAPPKVMSDIRPAAPTPATAATSVPAPTPAAPSSAASSPVRAAIVAPVAAAVPGPAPVATTSQPSPLNTTAPIAPAPPASPAGPAPIAPVATAASTPASSPASPSTLATPAVATIAQQDANMAATVAATPKSGVKASSVALSLVGLLLVGAYIWQVNYPNLALKVAGSKAGISANFPGYVPNGWKLSGNIISSPGSISYNIAGQKDGQKIAVSESKTNWDSQALAENYVAPKSADYLALQSQGLTIYLYNDNQASWVNNGNWYRLEGGTKGLSQDQIIKIATSL